MSPSSSVIQLRTRRIIIKSQSNYPYAPGQLALSLKSVHVALDPELPSCQTVPSPVGSLTYPAIYKIQYQAQGSPVWKQSAEALETPLKDQQGHMVATSVCVVYLNVFMALTNKNRKVEQPC